MSAINIALVRSPKYVDESWIAPHLTETLRDEKIICHDIPGSVTFVKEHRSKLVASHASGKGRHVLTWYNHVKLTVVAWEEPRDWSLFTHIILSGGIEYADRYDEFIKWLDGLPSQDRVFNPPNVIKWNSNKFYLEKLRSKGITLPRTVFLPSTENVLLNNIICRLEGDSNLKIPEIVVKGSIDAGGSTARRIRVDVKTRCTEVHNLMGNFQGGILIQEFMPSILSEGEWSIIFIDKKASHAVKKTPANGEFKVQSIYGGRKIFLGLKDVPTDIVKFSNDVIDCVEEEKLLYARVDLVRRQDRKPCLMELELFEPDLYLSSKELTEAFLDAICRY